MLDKTYSPAAIEAKHYDRWERSGHFACDPASGADPYVIMIPPPNVTGTLHMGHAFTMTLQDVLTRYHRRRGDDTLWQPGTDHAGIATQMVVERNLAADEGLTRHDLGRARFVEKIWEWKAQSGGAITGQLRRLGATPDWSRERFTMDEGLNRAVRRVFVQLYKQGLIYRDKRLVNWDPKLHTAISDLEVEQKETKGKLWHLRYPLVDDPSRWIVVATTRPETMLGDTAVAVHPEDDRYADLVGKTVRLPLVGREIPIIADAYADPEQGSGAVKITPAHDFNDYEVGKRNRLTFINVMDGNACILERAEVFDLDPETGHFGADAAFEAMPAAYAGLDRYEARKRIIADLEAQELLERIDDHPHTVPYGDRGGVPIEPWLTDQWYCDAHTLAQPAITAVEEGRTRFVPSQWTNVYFDWMRNIQPWCISRQLWWGHQIPAWFAPDGTVFVEETEEAARAAAEARFGVGVALTRDEDVLDTWFSSALWPFSTLGWPDATPEVNKYYPGSVLVTGFDIIFFWVARMMMMGIHFMGDVPFRDVYIHALVRDEKGQKMSKSKGNVIDPLEVIEEYGADSLRLTLTSMAAQGRDVKLSKDRVAGYRNFGTKLWNAARYCQMNGVEPQPGFDPSTVLGTVNRWIVGEVAKLGARVEEAMAAYRFNDVANSAYQFAWGTFCDWYLEFTKPVLLGEDEAAKAETRATTAWALDQILHLLNPVMPYLTEELWEQLGTGRSRMLITEPWPAYAAALANPDAEAEMDWVVRLVSTIRAIRAEVNVPPGAQIPLILQDASDTTLRRLETHGDIIRRMARLASIETSATAVPRGSAQAVLDEATLALPLADVIDLGAERARLKKEIDKTDGEIGKIDKKLGNAQFLAKAPDEVVAEQRDRRADLAAVRARLEQALTRISA